MNNKEALYFVAHCLTLSLEPEKRLTIQQQLQAGTVNWEAVVKVSTAQLVFPALYCNLKRANFLQYLPAELVAHMVYITDLNRAQNQQIMAQAKELNTLLLAHKITPIFLKGTGNLVAGLYEDSAERMVGDIDFIFSEEDYPKAIKVLEEHAYVPVDGLHLIVPDFRHYRRLKTENKIAAVEIHKELLIKKYASEFNYSVVAKDSQTSNGFAVLSYANKLNLSISASQINDNGQYYKKIALRNAYDVFVLSKKTNAKAAIQTLDKLSPPLNCFLAACYEVFDKPASLEYNRTLKTATYLAAFKNDVMDSRKRKWRYYAVKSYVFMKSRQAVLSRFIVHKEYRMGIFKILRNKICSKEKGIQFRL